MKKTLIISFFSLIQFCIYAQNESNWNIGIEFSIDDLSISNNRDEIDYIVTDAKVNGYAIKFDRTNYSIGITSSYLINENLGLSSGILYSNKDLTGTYNCATCDHIGTFPGYPSEVINQKFLVIPISINYKFLTGKFRPIVNGGFKNNLEIDNDLKEQSKGYFLEAFIGASIYYGFLDNWNAIIGYNYQTALSELYSTDEFNLRTNSFFLQINYSLK